MILTCLVRNPLYTFTVAVKVAKAKLKGKFIWEEKTPHLNWCQSEENITPSARIPALPRVAHILSGIKKDLLTALHRVRLSQGEKQS